jgi:hypothetical protein
MIKITAVIGVCLFIISSTKAQTFFHKNTPLTIAEGASIFVGGDFETNYPINNAGTITIRGDLNNQSSTGIFESQTGTVVLSGSNNQTLTSVGNWQFNKLILNKSSKDVYLLCSIKVDSLLRFSGGNLYIETYNVELGSTGNLLDESETSRIYSTTGTVVVKKNISFPLGTENISGIGFFIDAPTEVFGITEIIREHNSIPDIGNGSIARWFYVKPGIPSPTNLIKVKYLDNDNVHNETSLSFYTKKPAAANFFPKGGTADANINLVSSSFFLTLDEQVITLAPISNNSTCDKSNPDYVESIFLSPTAAIEGDTVYLVNLSLSTPDSLTNFWNMGDGTNYNTVDVIHIYKEPANYNVSLTINNEVCSDAKTKVILVKEKTSNPKNSAAISAILNSFLYYPNPVQNKLNLQMELSDQYESTITLLDVWGRKLISRKYNDALTLDSYDVSSLSEGMYILKLDVMGKVFTYRIVKY